MSEWYTRREVAELLNVTGSTIYHYAKLGKIKKVPDPHRYYRESRYYKKEVDQLAAERQSQPTGLSPTELAKELGVSVQTIYRRIKEGSISATEVSHGDESHRYVITEEEFKRAELLLKPAKPDKVRRVEYYDKKNDLALFQLYQSSNGLRARVMKDHAGQWGFFIQNYQKWVDLTEGLQKYDLEPAYTIHKPFMKNKGYVYMQISNEEDTFYPLIDYLYREWGVENAGVRDNAGSAFISFKAGEKPLPTAFQVEELAPFVKSGLLSTYEQLLIAENGYKRVSVDLPIEMLNYIKTLSDEEGISISQWIEHSLKKEIQ